MSFEGIKMPQNNNFEQQQQQKKNTWLNTALVFLDIDPLIGLESPFARIPTRSRP